MISSVGFSYSRSDVADGGEPVSPISRILSPCHGYAARDV